MSLDKKLLKILACPDCRGNILYKKVKSKEGLQCKKCRRTFQIKKGIPVMLPRKG